MSQAGRNGLRFTGSGEHRTEGLQELLPSHQRITLAAASGTCWKAMTLEMSEEATATAPVMHHQGLSEGRGSV